MTDSAFSTTARKRLNDASLIALAVAGGLCLPATALAQTAPPSLPAEDGGTSEGSGEIVVTGTRITRDGFDAPTPTTVLTEDEIKRDGAVNIATYLFQIPALAGSFNTDTNNTSAGRVGINALSLRNLGPQRTLILLDGQRMPAATTGDIVDINAIPNAIIKRVDIVTGGASAAWGSDAVAGVVNFVLDKTYTGIKGEASGGITTYGDDANYKVALTAGTSFAGGRGHLLVSGEASYNAGIDGMPRSWYDGYRTIVNPSYAATNGAPYFLVANNVGPIQVAPGAVVVGGPLAGTVFGPGGQVSRLNFGQVSGSYMIGGDWQVGDWHNGPQDLSAPTAHQNVFARLSYDVTDHINLYGQFMFGRSHVDTTASPYYTYGGITIRRDNAFLPASVAAAMVANNLTSLNVGSWNEAIGGLRFVADREMYRYTAGGSGDFDLFGSGWKWNAYWNKNVSFFSQDYTVPIIANYRNAIDAVMGPDGVPVCRSTLTNPIDGCVPLNILGTGVASSGGLNYVTGHALLDARIIQDIFAAAINGEPFRTWAGPVSVVFGAEHRRERADGTSDPISQVRGYWAGNYAPLVGSYNVTEGFVETVVPLLSDSKFGKSLDFNGAIRQTDYSTSGQVTTWKVGATYAPVEDFTLRITRSRDIRAGSLSVLFQPGQTLTSALFNPWTGVTENVQYTTVGNPQIAPEKADTLDIGGVFRPRWLPGLTLSVDYWDIDLKDAITTIGVTSLIDGCFTGQFPQFCEFVGRDANNNFTGITQVPVNIANSRVRGIDFEASYRLPIAKGNLTLRALATHGLESTSNSGLQGAVTVSTLGINSGGGLPDWRYTVTATYERGPFTGAVTARGVSDGVISNTYVECDSACPAYTAANPTISNNRVDGALYFDLSVNYKLLRGFEAFATIHNVANRDPSPYPSGPGVAGQSWGANPQYYDLNGRSFRAGIRFAY